MIRDHKTLAFATVESNILHLHCRTYAEGRYEGVGAVSTSGERLLSYWRSICISFNFFSFRFQ